MIKYTALPPKEKFDKINKIRKRFANYDADECLNHFNIRVEHEFFRVKERILQAPSLQYRRKKCQPRNGAWSIRGTKFFDGVNIESWWILSLANEYQCPKRDLIYFSRQLSEIGKAAGLELGELRGMDKISNTEKLFQKLSEIKEKNVSLTVVVLPDKSDVLYDMVKQFAEVELGMITQCILCNNAIQCNPSLLSNLCQKINAKLGGVNHKLVESEIPLQMGKEMMIMGADVLHSCSIDNTRISVAAVVGSLDTEMTRFAVTYKFQENENIKKKSVEIISDLKVMAKKLLKAFEDHTKAKPKKIIFYRDGVSNGEFSKVIKEEVSAIRNACKELYNGDLPMITFIVVQKRHHVRFNPLDDRDGVDKARNIPPGTVIDKDVVHPVHRDFYLCSHVGLKGTSIPSHYTILEDDNDFSPDNIQKLTYYLCNTYVRCTKSISHPVPVRYADLAAYHVNRLRPKAKTDDIDSQLVREQLLEEFEIPEEIRQEMFFV